MVWDGSTGGGQGWVARLRGVPKSTIMARDGAQALGEEFLPSISMLSHEGQQELGHRMRSQCWGLGQALHGMEDGGSVGGSQGWLGSGTTHPHGVQAVVSGVNSSPWV